MPLNSVAVTAADSWLTPLGTVAVDGGLRSIALTVGAVVDDEPHARDHALEVELPFLQQRAGEELRVLPAAVGGPVDVAAAAVEALSLDALIVVSTDLSHFHDDTTARRLDRRTAEAVVALDAGAIRDSDACGADALRALLVHAGRAGWRCAELERRTSADACGDTGHVVGYGAFAFTAP
jgi:AmmeMemoRadiSam system protein B